MLKKSIILLMITGLITSCNVNKTMEKTVLVSDVGGLTNLVHDGETGIVFKAGDAGDLTKKIITMAEDKGKRAELGRNARLEMIKNRDWSKIVPVYLNIYQNLFNEKK